MAWRKERSGYRNPDPHDLAAQKRDAETQRNAEAANHDHPCHAHAFGRGA